MKPKPDPNPQIVLQTLQQLRGLADALDRLHHCDSGTTEVVVNEDDQERTLNVPDMQITDEHDQMTDHIVTTNKTSIRHGDLKPENILRFMEGGEGLGMLKIADMGLAKQHIVETRDRTHLTSTRYGTIRYEAPEAVTAIRGGRSRLYDIWSMGCITLEFVIWILYGNDQLNNFYSQVKGDAKQVCQYFEILETGELRRPQVHHVVLQWINHIENTDPECAQDSALRDLLRLVREKLLVVPLPPNRESSLTAGRVLVQPGVGETITRYRATADEFRDALDKILSKVDAPNYLLTGGKRENVKAPLPRLSMLGTPAAGRIDGLRTPTDVIQLGLPDLLEPGTPAFFALLRLWLEDCSSQRDAHDVSHKACHVIGRESLPTRLIDVGTLEDPRLRLVETAHEKLANVKYIALSHPWGDTKQYAPFSTLRGTVDVYKVAIPYEKLPATFKDAVICTRNLNIRYIWVDSICIIQGKDGDFNEEATRMEDVFSGAFCVLAASRASNQHDGFLGPRAKQQFITMKRTDQKTFYVCKTINNFSKDVIDGSLNKRGWVLQERALARRTIYFTASQTYFECGEGIRCETLTKMRK
ncbi:hypothetical protein J4E80_004229 [Alternaria sp. BMP 0032]|nr:hypothetical protein J4E80_004229 [Alternaria sp. BMP 0032]